MSNSAHEEADTSPDTRGPLPISRTTRGPDDGRQEED